MAVVSTTKVLKANVVWDNAWATRPGSGAGFKWRIHPSAGVTINDPNAQTIMATFTNPGTYTAYLGCTDGAMPAFASTSFTIEEGTIEIPIEDDRDIEVPVNVSLPVGQAVYSKLDCAIMIDTSGSMGEEISTAKSQAGAIIDGLATGSADALCAAVPYADPNEYSYSHIYLAQKAAAISQVNAINRDGGGAESHFHSLERLVDQLSWRQSSLRVLLQFTDEPEDQDSTSSSVSSAIAKMNNNKIHYIHIWCDSSSVPSGFVQMANDTKGKYFSLGDGASGIVSAIKSALDAMSRNLRVELVRGTGTGTGLVKSISPPYIDGISPGDSFKFDVTFNRAGLPAGHGTQTYNFTLNVRTATDLALLDTIPVSVRVTW